jgi:hypothetical protein
MSKHKRQRTVSAVEFIDKLVKLNELGKPFQLTDHQREVLRLAFAFRSGRTLAVGHDHLQLHQEERQNHDERRVTLGWGFTQEAFNLKWLTLFDTRSWCDAAPCQRGNIMKTTAARIPIISKVNGSSKLAYLGEVNFYY